MTTFEEHLRRAVLSKEEIDVFLDPNEPSWAQYDPETGYILGNFMPRDGLDGSLTISTVAEHGERTPAIYADRPCRINTYGNSFTQCHQVSDHETWQEYLAAHLGEPIRNFGMGGYGVYQAYRRMLRTEKTDMAAEHIILYIWGDDHLRSVLRCRHALTYPWWNSNGGRALHGNFWTNVEMNIESGQFVERDSILPTPESLYKMTDPDFMVEALRDDLMLQISLFCAGNISDPDIQALNQLAEILGQPALTTSNEDELKRRLSELRDDYAFSSTKYIVDRAADFANEQGRKLMVVLFCPTAMRQLIETGTRYDQCIADYLIEKGIKHFDMNLVHQEDFKSFSMVFEDYRKRYFIGHYSPAGNHFFAFSIKSAIVDWLDPKPITYRGDEEAAIGFKGYLPEI